MKNTEKLPQHLAIIMDGNGRWALQRQHHRFYGHVRGARVAEQIIQEILQLGIPYLTLYVFSIENGFRPEKEVLFLQRLFHRYLQRRKKKSFYKKIRFSIIGDLNFFPSHLQKEIRHTVEETKTHSGLNLSLCFHYGGRQDIVAASKRMGQALLEGKMKLADIGVKNFSSFLSTHALPDPDLILRTSGEHRLSNFLLWESAYAEMIFVNTLWPDFKPEDLQKALREYEKRTRRFGLIDSSSLSASAESFSASNSASASASVSASASASASASVSASASTPPGVFFSGRDKGS